jgi:hypothetical protein
VSGLWDSELVHGRQALPEPWQQVAQILTLPRPDSSGGSLAHMRQESRRAGGAPRARVAVGTAVARCPPHRPVLALLTHTVPASDIGANARVGMGLQLPILFIGNSRYLDFRRLGETSRLYLVCPSMTPNG